MTASGFGATPAMAECDDYGDRCETQCRETQKRLEAMGVGASQLIYCTQ